MASNKFDLYITDLVEGCVTDAQLRAPTLPLLSVYYIQEELAHYLGAPWLVLPKSLVFGREDANVVDVEFESDNEASVCARCDLLEEAPQFLALLSDLVRFHGFRFFSPLTRQVIEPDLEIVMETIRASQTRS